MTNSLFNGASLERSSNARGAVNIMDMPNTSLSGTFKAWSDPILTQRPDTTQSSPIVNTATQTPMAKMRPTTSYTPPPVNTATLTRDATKTIRDGASVSATTNTALNTTKNTIANFQNDWKEGVNAAYDAMIDTAKEMNISPAAATDTLISDSIPTKAGALAYMGAEITTAGLGSLATMGKGVFLAQELSKEEKRLPPEKQKALLENTLARLQASPTPSDTHATTGNSFVSTNANQNSGINWQSMTVEDLKEMFEDPRGENQPEMQALRKTEQALVELQDHNLHIAEKLSQNQYRRKNGKSSRCTNNQPDRRYVNRIHAGCCHECNNTRIRNSTYCTCRNTRSKNGNYLYTERLRTYGPLKS